MSTLAIHVSMCRSGFWPEKISAAAWGIDNAELLRAEVIVRPRDGERTTVIPQLIAEREGMADADVWCALRLIGGTAKGKWTGLMSGARFLVVHDFEETDRRIRMARELFKHEPDWRRPATTVWDTLTAARTILRTEERLSLSDAAKAITGRDVAGVDALLAIFNTPEAVMAMRAAA
jgi:hypothetical protein